MAVEAGWRRGAACWTRAKRGRARQRALRVRLGFTRACTKASPQSLHIARSAPPPAAQCRAQGQATLHQAAQKQSHLAPRWVARGSLGRHPRIPIAFTAMLYCAHVQGGLQGADAVERQDCGDKKQAAASLAASALPSVELHIVELWQWYLLHYLHPAARGRSSAVPRWKLAARHSLGLQNVKSQRNKIIYQLRPR